MKALASLQPWATLLCAGIKTVETRKFETDYRGEVYVYAGERGVPLNPEMADIVMETLGFSLPAFPSGGIIGKVEITHCLPASEWVGNLKSFGWRNLLERERILGDLSEGRYVWIIDKPVLFEKIVPCKGGTAIWDLEDDTIDQLQYVTIVKKVR